MQELYINGLESLPIGKWAFRGLGQLGILTVARCGLVLAPNIQPLAHSLFDLYLYKNNITGLTSNYFSGCNLLSLVSLAHNKFRSIPDIAEIRNSLKILNMDDNLLTDISMLYQVQLPRLEVLVLSNNHIVSFPYPQWVWPRLRALDLQGNLLGSMTYDWFWNAMRRLTVKADTNPWNCSQDLCWVQECNPVTEYHSTLYKCGRNGDWFLPYGGLQCTSPQEWKGQRIEETGNTHVIMPLWARTGLNLIRRWTSHQACCLNTHCP